MTEDKPKAKQDPKQMAAGCGCLIAILAAIAVGVTMCSQPAENPAAKGAAKDSLRRSDPSITAVDRYEDNLVVALRLSGSWDEKGWLDGAAMAIDQVGRDLKRGAPEDRPPLETVLFSVTVPGTDRLGNETEIDLFNLNFRAADLRSANYDNLGFMRVLDLATEVSFASGHGRQVVAAWCADDNRLSSAPNFCRQAILR